MEYNQVLIRWFVIFNIYAFTYGFSLHFLSIHPHFTDRASEAQKGECFYLSQPEWGRVGSESRSLRVCEAKGVGVGLSEIPFLGWKGSGGF